MALLDRTGATHPPPDATHHGCQIGRHGLKWENHTEFTSFTAFSAGLPAHPFDPMLFDVFPADWLEAAPGVRVTSILLMVDHLPLQADGDIDEAAIAARLGAWFVGESLAVSRVLDGVVAHPESAGVIWPGRGLCPHTFEGFRGVAPSGPIHPQDTFE